VIDPPAHHFGMNAALAIYDALIQAKVSPDAAKAVVDALDRDMNTWLATKQDFHHFEQLFEARFDALEARAEARFGGFQGRIGGFEERIGGFEARSDLRFQGLDHKIDEVEARSDLKLQRLEEGLRQEIKGLGSQLTIRLGVLLAGMLGATVALQTLLH
jgi:hypothetical protein